MEMLCQYLLIYLSRYWIIRIFIIQFVFFVSDFAISTHFPLSGYAYPINTIEYFSAMTQNNMKSDNQIIFQAHSQYKTLDEYQYGLYSSICVFLY